MTTPGETPMPAATGQGDVIPVHTRSKYTMDDNVVNHEIRRKLWEGVLPLKIELSINDLFSSKIPSNLYVRIFLASTLFIDHGSPRKLPLHPYRPGKDHV